MSIIPISRESIENELAAEDEDLKETKELNIIIEDISDDEEGVETEETPLISKKEKDLFIKPSKNVTKEPKKKRQLSQHQLDNLAAAREKTMIRRKAIKEAKEIELKAKQIKKEQTKEAKLDKRLKDDEMIELKAQMLVEAQQSATWDEERIANLMEKTLDNYISKKKAQRPTPRETIPAPTQPNNPHVPMDPKYYMPNQSASYYNTQPRFNTPPQHSAQTNPSGDAYNTLFGNYH